MDETYPQNRRALVRPVKPIPQQEEQVIRISTAAGFLLIITAFGIDLFEMILEWLAIGIFGVSTLISICATTFFWIWFKRYGIRFTGKPKNMARFGITAFLEMIPGLDAVFGFIWTVGIFTLVASTMEEDGQSGIIVTIYKNSLKKIGL
jgi:hypothetical protein